MRVMGTGSSEGVGVFSSFEPQGNALDDAQAHGQAIQATLLYPAELADAHWPAATSILVSLQFDGDLLPIRAPRG